MIPYIFHTNFDICLKTGKKNSQEIQSTRGRIGPTVLEEQILPMFHSDGSYLIKLVNAKLAM